MRRKLIAGNWKMNGSLAANSALLQTILSGIADARCDAAVCVPAPYFAQCQSVLNGSAVAWGAQDVSAQESGAYTGEVSATMLTDFGCRFVIVGHSERREYHGETSELVAGKTARALAHGLTPIVCVGETLAQREAGKTESVVCSQLDAVIAVLGAADLTKIVVAYEPVWAIGTGKTATPQMAQDVHRVLRNQLAAANPAAAETVKILYGGSMKPDNARDLLGMADIDGGLIGGASLKGADFLAIIAAA